MYVMKQLLKYTLVCSLLYTSASHADLDPVIGIGLGGTNTINLAHNTTFPIFNPNMDEFYIYTPNNQTQTRGLIEAFLGAEYQRASPYLSQLGFAYTQTATLQPAGTLLQGADLQSADSYLYHYNVNLHQVMLQGKFMRLVHNKYYPYFLAGLGVAINSSAHFSTTVPINQTFTRFYADKTSTSFAFRLGLGMDIKLQQNVRFGLAYRITDEGKASLGSAMIDATPVRGTLSQSAVFANELLAHLTYIFA